MGSRQSLRTGQVTHNSGEPSASQAHMAHLAADHEPAPDKPGPRMRGWRIVEQKSDGSDDYVLLRRTKLVETGIDALTAREHDAVRHASTGISNKEIAYQMGISPSTVGVLLWRASRKLGATDREALIRAFAAPPRIYPDAP